MFNFMVFIKICKDKYPTAKLIPWYPSKQYMCAVEALTQNRKSTCPQTLLVCKALLLLTSSYFFPVLISAVWVLGTGQPLLSVSGILVVYPRLFVLFTHRHWLYFAYCFPSQVSPFHCLMWYPKHSIPPFSSQTLFFYTNITSFLLPSVSLFSCFPYMKIHHTSSYLPRIWVPMASHAGSHFSQFHGKCNFYLCLNILLSSMAPAAPSPSLLFFVILFSSLKDTSFRASVYKNLLGRWLELRWKHCFAVRY